MFILNFQSVYWLFRSFIDLEVDMVGIVYIDILILMYLLVSANILLLF
jgi:hypothetical protein